MSSLTAAVTTTGLWVPRLPTRAHAPRPLLQHEDRERIAAALLQLDTLHREVLVLRFHEELFLEEIAKVTRRRFPP